MNSSITSVLSAGVYPWPDLLPTRASIGRKRNPIPWVRLCRSHERFDVLSAYRHWDFCFQRNNAPSLTWFDVRA